MTAEQPKKDVLRETDAEARLLAKTLIREARHASLACLEPESGAPMASRVALAADITGAPLFLISQLSSHFAALERDPRASLLIGEPGKGDPLAHPRLTAMGGAEKVEHGPERDRLRARFLGRHPKAELYVDFADFAFWRLEIDRVSLNGGFGKAYALSAGDVAAPAPDGLESTEMGAVAHMNEDHLDAIAAYATGLLGLEPGPWRLASLDAEGLDLVQGDAVRRLWFDTPLQSADAMRPALVALAKKAREGKPAS